MIKLKTNKRKVSKLSLKVRLISGVFSIFVISILFFLDFILVEDVPIIYKVVYFFEILVLISICYLGYAYGFILSFADSTKKPKILQSFKSYILSLLFLAGLMFIGFYILDIYYDWQDRILSFIMTFLWFSLIRFTATTYSENKKIGNSLIVLIVLSFLYYFWTEIVTGHEIDLKGLEIYYLFFDYISLSIASVIGLKLSYKILVNLDQKNLNTYTKFLVSDALIIFYVILIYHPYLYFIHQTSLFRYKNFWYYELPLIITGLIILNIIYHYYDPINNQKLKKEESENKDESIYPDKLIINHRKKDLSITMSEIALFTIKDSITLAYTFSDEKYIVDKSLNDLENELNPQFFFRVTRQLILSLKGTIDYKNEVNQKLRVFYHPIQGLENNTIISRYKAPKFKKWFREN